MQRSIKICIYNIMIRWTKTILQILNTLTLLALMSEIVTKSWGGDKRPHLEINEGDLWEPMLLKVIMKPLKVIITCKILGPYFKYSASYWDLKNLSLWDFVLPWPTKIAITCSIFEIQDSYFGFNPLFMFSINQVLTLRLFDQFLKFSFFLVPPSKVGWG